MASDAQAIDARLAPDAAPRRARLWPPGGRKEGFPGRIAELDVEMLRAALLDGEAAVAAYRTWRPSLDFFAISFGQQRLIPMLQANLARLGIAEPLMERFRGIRRYAWARNLRSMTLARSVFGALDRAGIPFIVLKGAALIAAYLTDRSLRPMDDIDVLVPEDRLPDAVKALASIGLAPQGHPRLVENRRVQSEFPGWPFLGGGQNIDLHWKALHYDRRVNADDEFWTGSREAMLDGMPIRILDPADQLLQICAHAAQTFVGAAVTQWPADAALVIRGSPDLSWERLAAQAERHRLSAILAYALEFLRERLALPIPAETLAALHAASSTVERVEARLLGYGPMTRFSRPARALLQFQSFRRGSERYFHGSTPAAAVAFLKQIAGTSRMAPALLVGGNALLRWPPWLRRLTGRDRYRDLPGLGLLATPGVALDLTDPFSDETPMLAGWSIAEPGGRWTNGREASIAWRIGKARGPFLLFAEGTAFLGAGVPTLAAEIWANDRFVDTWRFEQGKPPPLPGFVTIPPLKPFRGGVLIVTFVIRSPRTPAELGMAQDRRRLGLYLRKILLSADTGAGATGSSPTPYDGFLSRGAPAVSAPKLPPPAMVPGIGDEIDFAIGRAWESAFLSGWGEGEIFGRWTVGPEASFAFAASQYVPGLALTISGDAFLHELAPRQEIELRLNGRTAATWTFVRGEASPLPAVVPVPPEAIGANGLLIATFIVREPRAPSDIGLSSDQRMLGLLVRRLALTVREEAAAG